MRGFSGASADAVLMLMLFTEDFRGQWTEGRGLLWTDSRIWSSSVVVFEWRAPAISKVPFHFRSLQQGCCLG
jgi:hypothetical protein